MSTIQVHVLVPIYSLTAPSEMPQNFAVTATNSRSISLVWDPPPEEHRNGIIIGYIINVSAVDPGEMFQLFTTNESTVVDDLKPFTTYFTAVAAQTNAGVGPFSTTIQADTAESCKYLKLEPFEIL